MTTMNSHITNFTLDKVDNVTQVFGHQGEPARYEVDLILKIVYLIIGALGLAGNSLVVSVILNYTEMTKSLTNLYIINQSIIDGTTALMLIIGNVGEDDGRHLEGLADEIYCKLWLPRVPLWSCMVSSSYNLVVMTMEKFLAIVHPLWHKKNWTRSKLIGSIVIAWSIGPIYQGGFKIPTTEIIDGRCYIFQVWPNQTTRRAVGLLTVFVQYFIPLFLLCFLYASIARVLRTKVEPADDDFTGTRMARANQAREKRMVRARRNVIKTLAIVACCYVLCWTCNQLYFFLINLGQPLPLSGFFYHFSVIAVFFNCCVNPFVYAAKYPEFQSGLGKLAYDLSRGRVGRVPEPPVSKAALESQPTAGSSRPD